MGKTAWKKILAASLCIGAVMGCCGCSGSQIALAVPEEKTDISFSWWGTDPRHDYTMAAIEEFEKLHPEIDVHLQYGEYAGYDQKFSIQMASRTEADVMQINYGWLDKFSPDGKEFLDLETVKDTLDLSVYDESVLSYGKSGGILNALSIALNAKVCLYNKDLYESFGLSLPETWDDLFAAAEKMKDKGVYPIDLDQYCALAFSVAYVEQKNGKAFINDDNTLNFTKDDVKEMLRFYMELVDRKVTPYVAERDDANYKNGIAAGIALWMNSAPGTESALKESLGQSTVVGKNPVMDGAKRSGWYLKPACFYVLSEHTAHAKESAMLLDFLVSGEEMAKLQGLEKGIPVSKKAREVLEEDHVLTGIMVEAEQVVNDMGMELMNPYFEDTALQEAFVKASGVLKYDGGSLEEAAQIAYEGMKDDLG